MVAMGIRKVRSFFVGLFLLNCGENESTHQRDARSRSDSDRSGTVPMLPKVPFTYDRDSRRNYDL